MRAIVGRWCFPLLTLLLNSVGALATTVSLEEAIYWTLASNQNIQLQSQQTNINLGSLQQAVGQFDTTTSISLAHDSEHLPLTQSAQKNYLAQGFSAIQLKTETTTYGVTLSKPLRNGVVFSPSISTSRTEGTTNDLSGLSAQTRGKVTFNIMIPLQQGRRDAARLSEVASTFVWEASKQDQRFAVAQGVFGTVLAYWKWVAARKTVEIVREAEASTHRMMDETQKLVEAEEIPSADLLLIRASLLDKTGARVAAEQGSFEALQKLAQSIGLSPTQVATLEPVEDFPDLPTNLPLSYRVRTGFVDAAMRQRADLASARLRKAAAKTTETAAGYALQPQLDLNVRVGYSTLVEDNSASALASAATQNRTSANIGATVSYQWPLENSTARGRYLQQAAAYEQAAIQVATLERSIGLGVDVALSALESGVVQVKSSNESLELYRQTVENEKLKHQFGSSTLIDVLSVNDRYLAARQNNITYRLGFFNSLAQLSYETGELLANDSLEQSINFDTFTRLFTVD